MVFIIEFPRQNNPSPGDRISRRNSIMKTMDNDSLPTEHTNTKKTFLLLGLAVGLIIVLIGIKAYKNQNNPTSSPTPVPSSQPTAATDEDLLKQAFANKYNTSPSEITVTIRQRVGDYASGGVNIGEGPGSGGVWFGVKQGDTWQIAADGNGIPLCSDLDAYNIPSELINSCVGEDSQLQQR